MFDSLIQFAGSLHRVDHMNLYMNGKIVIASAAETREMAVVAEKKDDADDTVVVAGSRRPHQGLVSVAPPLIVSLIAEAPGDVKYKTSGVEESVLKMIGPFDTAEEGSILRETTVKTGR